MVFAFSENGEMAPFYKNSAGWAWQQQAPTHYSPGTV
jgi:hypothetical protein